MGLERERSARGGRERSGRGLGEGGGGGGGEGDGVGDGGGEDQKRWFSIIEKVFEDTCQDDVVMLTL